MFEELPGLVEVSQVDDAALNQAISEWARAEAVAAAHRMAAVAALIDRRCATELARSREHWACDAWDATAAEIAADLTIGHRAASTLMRQALALRDRMPAVGALLARGEIPLRVANTVTWRTVLIDDPRILARVDADIAALATRFGALSATRLEDAIDLAVGRHDPDAVRRFHRVAKTCDVGFGKEDDETGSRSIWGRLKATDAALLERSVDALTAMPCARDPRTAGERRTAALAVLAVRGDRLPCLCGGGDCPATGRDPRADAVVIHVLTDAPRTDAGLVADAGPPECPPTTVIVGGAVIPAPLLAELVASGATIRPIATAAQLTTESGYRPSTALARFVRSRDLVCSFPGCDHPAQRCDLDHTIAYAVSALTHPGNLKALCRKHHLLKTFWAGPGGWTDCQLPDGTIIWTSPAGLHFRVPPAGRVYFPHWNTATPAPPVAPSENLGPGRDLAMPLRRRTRAQQDRYRITAERARNERSGDEHPPPF